MARQLTIRRVPDEVAESLATLSRTKGQSINTIVLQILQEAVGHDERRKRLLRYATWTEDEADEFAQLVAHQRTIESRDWE
ncbi:MAG: Arc family DNA-binding protein [Acidobacteriota bacterium]